VRTSKPEGDTKIPDPVDEKRERDAIDIDIDIKCVYGLTVLHGTAAVRKKQLIRTHIVFPTFPIDSRMLMRESTYIYYWGCCRRHQWAGESSAKAPTTRRMRNTGK